MSVVHPWALLGLGAAFIPLLLHLIQRRPPPEQLFPAVRYLEQATAADRRRVALRDVLLLVLRTALIILVVLAAAGVTVDRAVPLARHAPMAAVLIVDNSASSGAVVAGEATVESLRRAAREVLSRATPADRLWLILSDGVPRAGSSAELRGRLDSLRVSARWFDLGEVLRQGSTLLQGAGRPGEIVVISDAQRTALSPVPMEWPTTLLRPTLPPPDNRAVVSLGVRDAPWGSEGGHLTMRVTSGDTNPVATTVTLNGAVLRELNLTPGMEASLRVTPRTAGWQEVRAAIPPDELRLDDVREGAVRVAPPPGVAWTEGNRYLDAALAVLMGEHRLRPARGGGAVRIGDLGAGPSVVEPPQDLARIGAVNRALAARGVGWQFGQPLVEESRTDSSTFVAERIEVTRRLPLVAAPERGGGAVDTLATVEGTPWIVHTGDVVLLGSRLDPAWTTLPVRAAFVPLLDALVSRVAQGAALQTDAVAGEEVRLPPTVTAVRRMGGGEVRPVSSGWMPEEPGGYWLLTGADTVGSLTVGIDPRESELRRASEAEVAAAWPGARVADLSSGASRTFTAGGRGDLRPLLLLLALGALIGESVVAGRVGRAR